MRTPLVLLSCLTCSSCILGPQPESPAPPVPGSIRGDSAPDETSFGNKAWRQVFTDSMLRSLIERALENNPDLVAATYRIEQARARAMGARAGWFPRLDGSAGTSRDGNPPLAMGGGGEAATYDIGAALSWELDVWGGIRRSNEAARAQLLEAGYRRAAVQTSLVAAVATAYIQLRNLDERLAISQRTVESRQASLDLVTSRRDGGVSSDLEVGQAEALLGQARTAIPVTRQAISAKENEIRVLLGDFPAAIARGGGLESLDPKLRIKGGLPSGLLARRPDIAAADQAYQAAVAGIGVAEALRFPSLSLTGSGGVLSRELGNLLKSDSTTWSIGGRIAGTIFDAGLNRSRADAARAQAREALANHNRAVKQAFREAANAIDAHTRTGEIITEQSRLVEANRKVARVASDRFEGGESSYLEVLDAERSLFESELVLTDARANRLLAVVEAYRALGGGWK